MVRLPPVRGLLHGINTAMCHKRDLKDQQWKILDPQFLGADGILGLKPIFNLDDVSRRE